MHTPVAIRPANRGDLAEILRLYAEDDLLGSEQRSRCEVTEAHRRAFEAIAGDLNNGVYVAELEGEVAGTFQLTFIAQLTHGGGVVAQVESVFVRVSARSRGVGEAMLGFARAQAEARGAFRLQLTSNVQRERAHRFYERLGFRATHKGMKLYLAPQRERATES